MQQRPRLVSRRGGCEPGPFDVARQLAAEVDAAQDVVHVDADGLAKLRAVEPAARGDVVRRRLLASGLRKVVRLPQQLPPHLDEVGDCVGQAQDVGESGLDSGSGRRSGLRCRTPRSPSSSR
jgi:hypothetical protein